MTLKQTLRYRSNKELVKLLEQLVESNPDLRFSQILSAFSFIKHRHLIGQAEIVWEDEFYKEPNEVLKRVIRRVKDIK